MKSLLQLLLVLMTSTLIANPSSKVDFIEGSLGLAIQKAGNEGKLLFVEFGAQWCMPCRFMEQNTFKDRDVATYMNDNYVPVKIDIDDFDGYAYKQKYHVEALPTFLIFNSEGKVIDRYEQSMAPSNLMSILKMHNHDGNRRQISTDLSPYEIASQLHEAQKTRLNVSPYDASKVDQEVESATATESEVTPPIVETINETAPVVEQRFDETPIMEETVAEDHPSNQSPIEMSNEELWVEEVYEMESTSPEHKIQLAQQNTEKLEVAKPEITYYTVRVGNFANNKSMKDFVKATSAVFIEDTHIFENHSDGLTSYEVCLGAFATENSANLFIDRLGLLNINGEVKAIKQ